MSCNIDEMRVLDLEDYEEVPSAFLPSESATLELIPFQDWIIFGIEGSP